MISIDPSTVVGNIVSTLAEIIPHIITGIYNLLTFTPAEYPASVKQSLYHTQMLGLFFAIVGIAAIMYVKYDVSYRLFQQQYNNIIDGERPVPDTDATSSTIFKTERASVGAVLFVGVTLTTAYFVRYDSIVFDSVVSFITVSPPSVFSPESIVTAMKSPDPASPIYTPIWLILFTVSLGWFAMVFVIGLLKSVLLGVSIIVAPLAVGSRTMHIPAPLRAVFRGFTHISVITAAMLLTLNAVFFAVGLADIEPGSQAVRWIIVALPLLLIASAKLGSEITGYLQEKNIETLPLSQDRIKVK